MLKCIAIDDEPLALRQIAAYIAKVPYLELVARFNNALEAQQRLAEEKIDLIFVDVNMPDLNGVDFVRGLVERPMVIFTTAYSEYAVEGFKLDAVDYLLKPFSFADFSRAAAKANSLYELRHNQRPAQEPETEALPPRGAPFIRGLPPCLRPHSGFSFLPAACRLIDGLILPGCCSFHPHPAAALRPAAFLAARATERPERRQRFRKFCRM